MKTLDTTRSNRIAIPSHTLHPRFSIRSLLGGVALYFCLTQVLLNVFLGSPFPWFYGLAAIGIIVVVGGVFARPWAEQEPSIEAGTLALCWAIALVLLLLAGEGGLFYANPDWQVRGALLSDMTKHEWPFVYRNEGERWLLRAPLGMYFVPALVGQWAGERTAGFVMLTQNAFLFGTLLAVTGAALPSARAKLIGLVTFLVFSGLDAVGSLKGIPGPWDHIEHWLPGLQFSSTVTLLFWVPHHAIAGWAGAVAYLLWRAGLAPARAMLTITPLVGIWSPLAMIGLVPFAAHVGASRMTSGKLNGGDVLVPAAAVLLTLPALIYLGADPAGAPMRLLAPPMMAWLPFQMIETFPYLIPLWSAWWKRPQPWRLAPNVSLIVTTLVLLILPFCQIGESTDLMMRASIPALAVLAFLAAEELSRPTSEWRKWLVLVLGVGAITPVLEITRAFKHPAAPQVACTIYEAWDVGPAIYGAPVLSKGTYLARLELVPPTVRPKNPQGTPAYAGEPCWEGYWYSPLQQ